MSSDPQHARVTVLIADDSAFMRRALTKMIESDDALTVIGSAQSGAEALSKINYLQPDVVTMDIDMPGMDGLQVLKRVMADKPRPVIIVSSLARGGGEATMEALALGAFDCIAKGLSYASADVLKVENELISKIRAAAVSVGFSHLATPTITSLQFAAVAGVSAITTPDPSSAITQLARVAPRKANSSSQTPTIIAIGTSTGGPKALQYVLSALPADLAVPIVIVQHMPVGFTRPFAQRLNDLCAIEVHEAANAEIIENGHAYIAPAGKHLTIQRRNAREVMVRLSPLPRNVPHTPSVDIMMNSVAAVFRGEAMGVILTGMGADGAQGMRAIYREGGRTLGQDKASCVVYGMPRSCEELGVLGEVAALKDIPARILSALRTKAQN
jgi:two-component system chemotaxis response regulator CheB